MPPEREGTGWRASAESLGGSGWILAVLSLGAGTGTGGGWTPVTPTRETEAGVAVDWVAAALLLGAGTGVGVD